jgi:hypothetical protein
MKPFPGFLLPQPVGPHLSYASQHTTYKSHLVCLLIPFILAIFIACCHGLCIRWLESAGWEAERERGGFGARVPLSTFLGVKPSFMTGRYGGPATRNQSASWFCSSCGLAHTNPLKGECRQCLQPRWAPTRPQVSPARNAPEPWVRRSAGPAGPPLAPAGPVPDPPASIRHLRPQAASEPRAAQQPAAQEPGELEKGAAKDLGRAINALLTACEGQEHPKLSQLLPGLRELATEIRPQPTQATLAQQLQAASGYLDTLAGRQQHLEQELQDLESRAAVAREALDQVKATTAHFTEQRLRLATAIGGQTGQNTGAAPGSQAASSGAPRAPAVDVTALLRRTFDAGPGSAGQDSGWEAHCAQAASQGADPGTMQAYMWRAMGQQLEAAIAAQGAHAVPAGESAPKRQCVEKS